MIVAEPKVLVLRAAGVNCNEETAYAFEVAGASTQQVHINALLENPKIVDEFGAVALPGGFSYGDDISAGRVLAIELDTRLGDVLRSLLGRGGLILGICNGFQALIKSGLLSDPQSTEDSISATLVENECHHYVDRWVTVALNSKKSLFVEKDDVIDLPIAHAEGRFVAADEQTLDNMMADNRVVLQYVTEEGGEATFPGNPNGSQRNVAGICDSTGQVLGLMPHPERFIFPWQHPHWTRNKKRENCDGMSLFYNAVKNLKS
ncbi:MAG: phosphoribosylformylglycinamidine synthase I [Planctomycetota bacterium]|jgi:phosphoribosylformylglycinamidine synthase I